MSTTTARAPRSFTGGRAKVGRFELANVIAAIGITIAILLPFFFDSGSGFIGDSTTALAYVVMALGLNIVVGFAGLLDLGYVAFFAIGAYTMGWFGSSWFSHRGRPHRRRRAAAVAAGHPPELAADPAARGASSPRRSARSSASRRCACAATTSRS